MDKEVISTIETYVNSSFYKTDQIIAIICEELFSADELNQNSIAEIIEEKISLKLIEEKKWPKITHNDLLDKLFRKLNNSGFIALHNVKNFASGLDEATDIFQDQIEPKSSLQGFCFYQWQDTEVAINGGGLRISYGDLDNNKEFIIKIGNKLIEEIKKIFPKAEWNGDQEKKILIPNFKWRKRNISKMKTLKLNGKKREKVIKY